MAFCEASLIPIRLYRTNFRIDSNVEETAINIDSAHGEIVRYFHSISQNRWLMIKVFGVLMVFFIIFVMFLT